MTQRQSPKPTFEFSEPMSQASGNFKDLLQQLSFQKEHLLETYSPISALSQFELNQNTAEAEITPIEMQNNETGMRKLLANMLAQCKPGILSDDDMDQLSGINGREFHLETQG